MALPHVPHQAFGNEGVTSDTDRHMEWRLPLDFDLEQCSDSTAISQETRGLGFEPFDSSNFEASSEFHPFTVYPLPQQQTINPTLLTQPNWPSSGTDSTSSSFGTHSSRFENYSSTSSAGTDSTSSSFSSHNQKRDSYDTSQPNKRRHCELPMDDHAPSASQVQLVYSNAINIETDQTGISIFESWLSTCPSIYPEDPEFSNLAALTNLDVGIVKSWFVKRLRAGRMDNSMFETWLCSYPSVYPGEEEFRNLAALTRLSLDTVRVWFAQKLRCKTPSSKPINGPSATGYSGLEASSHPHGSLPATHAPQQPSLLQEAALWVKEERGPKCIASLDQSVLLRDDNKPFQCTRKCGKKFRDRDDWRKHEEVNWPQEGYLCDLPATVIVAGIQICTHCGMPNPEMNHFQTHKKSVCNNKTFTARGRLHHRKQHFLQHFDNVHPHVPCDYYLKNSHFLVASNFPRRCGFCRHRFAHWKDRIDHVGAHFHDDARDMTEWNDHSEADSQGSDQRNDRGDDDDGNPDDDSDSSDDDSNDFPPRSAPKRPNQAKPSRSRGRSGTSATRSRNRMLRLGLSMLNGSFEVQFSTRSGDYKTLSRSLLHKSLSPSDTAAGDGWTLRHNAIYFNHFDILNFLDTLETPPYTRIKVLGCGPYSVVDEVQNLATGAVFARKTINYPNQREFNPLVTEIEIMQKLDHSHIVKFIDTYTLDKSVSIIMSPVADFDLGYWMSKHRTLEPIPLDSIIQWFSCLVSSVEYLHGRSIKHQDIKPSNILIREQTIFLADFGIAKTFVDSEPTVSTSGDMTKKYCSPETAQNGLRGRKADIFSLGCVFLEMFSLLIYQGQLAFVDFQESHFIGDGTYQENLPMVKLWIGLLRREPIVERNANLRRLLDSCEAMLEQSSKNRPSAAELSATLPPGQCCLPAKNVSDSKSDLEEREGTQTEWGAIIPQNLPQSGILEDQTPTAVNEQIRQRTSTSVKVQDSLPPQMCDRSGSLKLVSSRNIIWWDACCLTIKRTRRTSFPSFSVIITLIGALLLAFYSQLTLSPPKTWSHEPRILSLARAAFEIKKAAVPAEENISFGVSTFNWIISSPDIQTRGDLFNFYPSGPFDAELVELGSEWPSPIDLTCSRCHTYRMYSSTQNHDSNLGLGQDDCLDQTFNASGLIHISPEDTYSISRPFQSSPGEWTGRWYSTCYTWYNYSTIEEDLCPSSIIGSVDVLWSLTTWHQGPFQTYNSSSLRLPCLQARSIRMGQVLDLSSFQAYFVQSHLVQSLLWVLSGLVFLLPFRYTSRKRRPMAPCLIRLASADGKLDITTPFFLTPIKAGADCMAWAIICLLLFGRMLLGGIYEAFIDYRIVSFSKARQATSHDEILCKEWSRRLGKPPLIFDVPVSRFSTFSHHLPAIGGILLTFDDNASRNKTSINTVTIRRQYDHKVARDITGNTYLTHKLRGKTYRVKMVAISGAIGIGLFFATGRVLLSCGPASTVIAFGIVGILLFLTLQGLAECIVLPPAASSLSAYSTLLEGHAWGFVICWRYAIQWLVGFPLEILAASITLLFGSGVGFLADRYGRRTLYGLEMIVMMVSLLHLVLHHVLDENYSINVFAYIILRCSILIAFGICVRYGLNLLIAAVFKTRPCRAQIISRDFHAVALEAALACEIGLALYLAIVLNAGPPEAMYPSSAATIADAIWRYIIAVEIISALIGLESPLLTPEVDRHETPWANDLLEPPPSSMPHYQQTGSSSNTEATPPISPSLFLGFDANNASISLRVEDELVSTEMP